MTTTPLPSRPAVLAGLVPSDASRSGQRRPEPPDSPGESPHPARLERRLLLGGIGLGLAYLVATVFIGLFFASTHPPMDATPQEAAIGFHAARTMVGVGTWLLLLPLPLGMLFLGGLTSVLHRLAGFGAAAVALLAGGAALVVPAIGGLVSSLTPAIGGEDTSAAAGAVVKALDAAMPLSVASSGFARAVLVLLALAVLSRAALVGRGTVRFGWLVAGASLLGTGTLVTQALFPLAALSGLLFAAWAASVAVVLRRRLSPAG